MKIEKIRTALLMYDLAERAEEATNEALEYLELFDSNKELVTMHANMTDALIGLRAALDEFKDKVLI